MAISKTPVTILGPTSVDPGKTIANPAGGTAVDVRAYAGGEWSYKITNGTMVPAIACTLVLQTSHDGTNWYDYYPAMGNLLASGVVSGSVTLSRGVMYVRAIAYGNTSNPVTVESYLQAVVG